MIALVALLLALLAAVVVLAAVAITSRNRTIQTLKGEVIIRTLAVRDARRERDAGRQALVDTECALGLAKEVLAERDMPQWEIDLLTETPIHDAVAADEAQREATILQFKREIETELGGSA